MLEKFSQNSSISKNIFLNNVLSLSRNPKNRFHNLSIMSKIFITFIVLAGLSINLFSQATSSASVGATIVEPIILTKPVDLNFRTGTVIFAGTVTMVPGAARPGTPTIMLPVTEGVFTAAVFVVEGTAGYAYTVAVPSSPLEIKSGDQMMVVDSFIRDPIINPETDLYSGVYVMTTPLNVTVNYN